VFSSTYNCKYLFSNLISIEVFILISVAIISIFSFLYLKKYRGDRVGDIGFAMIIVGGVLNTSEWLKNKCVKDYLNFFSLFHFNFPDILVTIGVVLVFIAIWKKKLK